LAVLQAKAANTIKEKDIIMADLLDVGWIVPLVFPAELTATFADTTTWT
jgi:hypothetical protein